MPQNKSYKRKVRHQRVRARISGTKSVPRVSVFRSHRHFMVQVIDDQTGKTLVSAHDLDLKDRISKSDRARHVAQLLSEKAKDLGITKVVFDRGGYRYHGRIKAFADSLREGNLKF